MQEVVDLSTIDILNADSSDAVIKQEYIDVILNVEEGEDEIENLEVVIEQKRVIEDIEIIEEEELDVQVVKNDVLIEKQVIAPKNLVGK